MDIGGDPEEEVFEKTLPIDGEEIQLLLETLDQGEWQNKRVIEAVIPRTLQLVSISIHIPAQVPFTFQGLLNQMKLS